MYSFVLKWLVDELVHKKITLISKSFFISLYIKCCLILDCWLAKTSNLGSTQFPLGICDVPFLVGLIFFHFCRLNSNSVHQKNEKSVGGTCQPFKRQPDSFFYEGSQLWHFYVWKYSQAGTLSVSCLIVSRQWWVSSLRHSWLITI